MKYDFSTIMNRSGMDAIAVDHIPYEDIRVKEGFSLIPMWVADMNFQTVPAIPEAIIERTRHAAYGYFDPRKEYYDAIIRWHRVRNGVEGLTEEAIGYENGVLGGIVSAMNVLCSRGDKILLHAPTQMVSEDAKMRTIAMYAPSKTFNLAGLVGSYHVIYNSYLRERIEKESSLSHYNAMNLLSMYALMGGYSDEGMEWVDELRQVLTENVDFAYRYIKTHFEGVELSRPQGTYMLFLDCRKWCEAHHITIGELQKKGVEVGVIWQDGRPFHGEYGIRMNVALPRVLLEEAMERLKKWVFV